MEVMVFLDDGGGMLFNHRRQSRDKVLVGKIQQLCRNRRLWMNAYSSRLYGDLPGAVVDEDFLAKAGPGELCLVETEALLPVADQIEVLYVFRWNRRYPADLFLDLPLDQWDRIATEEFPGSSHEKLTLERYEKGR